jgi:V8-like Glu-specific endopeptidase
MRYKKKKIIIMNTFVSDSNTLIDDSRNVLKDNFIKHHNDENNYDDNFDQIDEDDNEIDDFNAVYEECKDKFNYMLEMGEVLYYEKKKVIDRLLVQKGYKNKVPEIYSPLYQPRLSPLNQNFTKKEYKKLPGHPGWIILEKLGPDYSLR